MIVDVEYDGIEIGHGLTARVEGHGWFVELEQPLPVGTALELRGELAAAVRVKRVHEGQGAGVLVERRAEGAKPAEAKPVEAKAVEAKPVDAKVEPKPVDAKADIAVNAEAKAVDAKAVEAKAEGAIKAEAEAPSEDAPADEPTSAPRDEPPGRKRRKTKRGGY